MFKRVEKHRLKKEEEETLGIDDEMVGFNDTDSEESTSESGLSDDEENVAGSMVFESDDSENSSGVETKDDPLLSVDQALHDPIYVVSVYPEVKACIVCPGKHLKGQKMTQLHRTSNAHDRRFKQFKALANTKTSKSAWEVVRCQVNEDPRLSMTQSAPSNRTEKRKAFRDRQKLRRSKFKEMKLKKTALFASLSAREPDGTTAPGNDNTKGDMAPTPLLKKRKTSGPDNDATSDMVRSSQVLTKAQQRALPTPPPKSQQTTSTSALNTDHSDSKKFTHEDLERVPVSKNTRDKVKHIVTSTQRTKNARLKAMGKRKLGKSSILS